MDDVCFRISYFVKWGRNFLEKQVKKKETFLYATIVR